MILYYILKQTLFFNDLIIKEKTIIRTRVGGMLQ